jgi:hypothetical protein
MRRILGPILAHGPRTFKGRRQIGAGKPPLGNDDHFSKFYVSTTANPVMLIWRMVWTTMLHSFHTTITSTITMSIEPVDDESGDDEASED